MAYDMGEPCEMAHIAKLVDEAKTRDRSTVPR